jgi:hypothetical protein
MLFFYKKKTLISRKPKQGNKTRQHIKSFSTRATPTVNTSSNFNFPGITTSGPSANNLERCMVFTVGVALVENDLICCLVLLPCLGLRLIRVFFLFH